jgi:hypothetical protein
MQYRRCAADFYAAGFSLLFFLVAFNAVANHGMIDWFRTSRFGQQANAVVSRTERQNHATCYFTYTIASRQYESSDSECDTNIGQVITVMYLPSDPAFATVQSPQSNLAFVTFVPFGMSALAGILAAIRTGRRNSSNAS